MSQQGAPLDVPSHLKDASRERLLAEIGTIQHQAKLREYPELLGEIARLQSVVNDLTTQLILVVLLYSMRNIALEYLLILEIAAIM